MKTVVHLIDDRTPGGVTRMVAFLTSSPDMNCNQQTVDFNKWKSISPAPDVIVSHLSVCWRNLPAFLALRARFPNTRLIHIEHCYTQSFTAMNVAHRARFFGLLRTSYAVFDKVVCVSKTQTGWMLDRELVAPHALETINSVVDLVPFSGVPEARPTPRTLGLVGRLDRQKGFDIAVRAFLRLRNPKLRLKIFGVGAQEQMLRHLARLDRRISFSGFVNSPKEAYANVDAILMPSRWESFGLVAAEAIAAGRPVLAAAVDGLRDRSRGEIVLVSGHDDRLWSRSIDSFCTTRFSLKPCNRNRLTAQRSEQLVKWCKILHVPH